MGCGLFGGNVLYLFNISVMVAILVKCKRNNLNFIMKNVVKLGSVYDTNKVFGFLLC